MITEEMKKQDEQQRLGRKKERSKLLIADFADFEKGKISVNIFKRHQKTQKNLKGKLHVLEWVRLTDVFSA